MLLFISGVCLHKRRTTSPSCSCFCFFSLLCTLRPLRLFENNRFKFHRLCLLSSTKVLMKQVERGGGQLGDTSSRSSSCFKLPQWIQESGTSALCAQCWKFRKVVAQPPCFHAPSSSSSSSSSSCRLAEETRWCRPSPPLTPC